MSGYLPTPLPGPAPDADTDAKLMNDRIERTVTVVNPLGLHARAAAQLVKLTSRMPCEVFLESEGQRVNGKSIMGVLMLAAAQGTEVLVICEGDRARESSEAIAGLFAAGFNEMGN